MVITAQLGNGLASGVRRYPLAKAHRRWRALPYQLMPGMHVIPNSAIIFFPHCKTWRWLLIKRFRPRNCSQVRACDVANSVALLMKRARTFRNALLQIRHYLREPGAETPRDPAQYRLPGVATDVKGIPAAAKQQSKACGFHLNVFR